MTHFSREIDRPLGQPRSRTKGERHAIDLRTVLLSAGALAAVAASGAIALRDKPFRDPTAVVVSTPEQTAQPTEVAAAIQQPKPAASGSTDGPSIIHVNPDSASKGTGVVVIHEASSRGGGQDPRFAHLPDKALIEESETGPLPVRAADGRRPFDVYARPWSGTRGAKVAIVLGGLGVSQTGTQAAIAKLPPEVTLAFASGGNSLGRWMQQARQSGHEIVMQVPLEPFDYPNVDPGRNTLTLAATPEENGKSLRWALSRITNYTGVMNYMGARFVADRDSMNLLMSELGKRGLMYLDDGSTARTLAPDLAQKNGVPFATGDGAIDDERDRTAILKKLDQLEATARAKGTAIGTASAFDVSVDAVTEWVAEAKKRGIEIVPVSAIAADPEKR